MADEVKKPQERRPLIPEMFEAPPDWPAWMTEFFGRPDCLAGQKLASGTDERDADAAGIDLGH